MVVAMFGNVSPNVSVNPRLMPVLKTAS